MLMMLSLIVSCLFGLGSISPVPQIEQDQQYNVEYVEEKVRDNYLISSDYFFLLWEDLESAQFGNDLFSNIDTLGTEFNNFPSDIAYPTSAGSSITATIGDAVNGSVFGYFRMFTGTDVFNIIGYDGFPVSEISFTKFYTYLVDTGQRYYTYEVAISGRQGNGSRVDYVHFVYNFYFPLYYQSTSGASYISLGNSCFFATYEFPSGSPFGHDNYYKYVYQEYLGEGYSSPLYNAYYGGLNTSIDIDSARQQGYNEGWNNGRTSGFNEGRQQGYSEGIEYASQQDTTALQIFTGFVNVGLLPVNVFLQMFNYEVFGINIAGLLTSILTIAIIVIIVRVVTGKKND